MVPHFKFMMSQNLLPFTRKGENSRGSTNRDCKNGVSSGTFIAEATTETLNNEDGIASFLYLSKIIKKRESVSFIESKAPEVVKEKQRTW